MYHESQGTMIRPMPEARQREIRENLMASALLLEFRALLLVMCTPPLLRNTKARGVHDLQ
jgi:hypothetical protein